MDYPISEEKIREMIDHIKKFPPYTESDKEFYQFDGQYDKERMKSKLDKWTLENLGINVEKHL